MTFLQCIRYIHARRTGYTQDVYKHGELMVFLKKLTPAESKLEKELNEKRKRFIEAGGVLDDVIDTEKGWMKINIRIHQHMIDEIESLLKRNLRETRTSFILDAIQEKIDRLKE